MHFGIAGYASSCAMRLQLFCLSELHFDANEINELAYCAAYVAPIYFALFRRALRPSDTDA